MPWVNDRNSSLLTDLYELTMAASYHAHGMNEPATFDLFVRQLPSRRNFLIACGIEDAIRYLEHLSFDEDDIAYLRTLGLFEDPFLEALSALTFTGDVWAIPEGEAVFPGEPILRVTAPLIEAQIVETFLLNCVAHQTMIASKAARVVLASAGRNVVDFSARRDHGADAALKGARAAYVGGASATSNVLAGRFYDIPLSGTMAHSYVMAFENELEAFRTFVRDMPGNAVLLIDTFDVEEGARNVVTVAEEIRSEGITIRAVRIDSGDLEQLTKSVRHILDDAGCSDIQIFLSGDLDEYRIRDLISAGAPVDGFGVGTQLGTSGDAPSLGAVYKLVEDVHGPKAKRSAGKATLAGRKQIYRFQNAGRYDHDLLALEGETIAGGDPLLEPVLRSGEPVGARPTLAEARERCRRTLARLPEHLLTLDDASAPYEVRLSAALEELRPD